MIELRECNKILSILGFRETRLRSIDDFLTKIKKGTGGIPLQVLDANLVAGSSHLLFATINALHAFQYDRNISKRLEIEILLYASGQRQIKKAMEMLGLKKGTSEIAVVFVVDDKRKVNQIEKAITELIPGIRADQVLELTEKKVKHLIEVFGITDTELKTMSKSNTCLMETLRTIIIERIALSGIKH
ncbi:MAG: KEOPS complex subunit Cgi121 [Candidatus Ranarchaeia archaeon]|jgi:KEOPS complex subunit Cgi121